MVSKTDIMNVKEVDVLCFCNDKSCRPLKCCKSIQIANYKSAGYQRGRRQGRSLRIRPHPAGVQGVPLALALGRLLSDPQVLQVLKAQGAPPLPPTPPKIEPKIDKKSDQKIDQIFDPKWPPKVSPLPKT